MGCFRPVLQSFGVAGGRLDRGRRKVAVGSPKISIMWLPANGYEHVVFFSSVDRVFVVDVGCFWPVLHSPGVAGGPLDRGGRK